MGNQTVSSGKLGEVRRYLEDVSNEKNRKAASSLFGGALASVSGEDIFHSDKGLSPAAGIVCDPAGRIIVSDEFNHRLLVYGADLTLEKTVGSEGTGNLQFRYPRGLAFGPGGDLYVTDAWNHRVVVLGQDLSFKGKIGKLGTGPGEMDEPVGIAVSAGLLFVLEKSNHRVQLFTLDGAFRGTIGKRGSVEEQGQFYVLPNSQLSFNSPVFEYPSAIAVDRHGNLFIADTNNHRVVKLLPDGGYDSHFNPADLRYPVGLSCDAEGNLHVAQFNREGIAVISQSGVRLYCYVPKGIVLPSAIAVSGGMTLVGGALRAGISRMQVQTRHDASATLEGEFTSRVRMGLSGFRAGRREEGEEHFSQAVAAEDRDPAALTALAPEGDFAFAHAMAAAEGSRLDPFLRVLDECAESLWKRIDSLMESKVSAAAENARATLALEKAVLAGVDSTDKVVVERFRTIKTVLNLSRDFKKAAYDYKRVIELRRRFAHAGYGPAGRLAGLTASLERFAGWKRKREQWFSDAAREAPALTFNSMPEDRVRFSENELTLELTAFEFRFMWHLAAEQNGELAALLSANAALPEEPLMEYADAATLFFVHCPEDFMTRLNYFYSLERLFCVLGGGRIARMEASVPAGAWSFLGREDNIPAETNADVYRLLPGIWADAPLSSDGDVDASSWDKIVDFYHAEFGKYLAENTPLRTELVRGGFTQPMAEKSDPKQSVLLLRKLSLLRFHIHFQDRYIGNLMAEYLVRFPLFARSVPAVGETARKRTADLLERTFHDTCAAWHEADRQSVQLAGSIPAISDIGEKQRLRVQMALANAARDFHTCLAAHIGAARGALARPGGSAAVMDMGASLGFPCFPTAAEFAGDGTLYVLASFGIFVFGPDGRFRQTFGGQGNAFGKVTMPVDLHLMGDGTLVAAQHTGMTFSLFSSEGQFLRNLTLRGDEGRTPLRVKDDGAGRLYVSFADGNDISIYDMEGNKSGVFEKRGTALEQITKLYGFIIRNGALIAGGEGRFVRVSLDRSNSTAIVSDIPFGIIPSLCADREGNLYAVDHHNCLLVRIDPGFTAASRVELTNAIGPCNVAEKDGVLAICDNLTHRVLFLRPSSAR